MLPNIDDSGHQPMDQATLTPRSLRVSSPTIRNNNIFWLHINKDLNASSHHIGFPTYVGLTIFYTIGAHYAFPRFAHSGNAHKASNLSVPSFFILDFLVAFSSVSCCQSYRSCTSLTWYFNHILLYIYHNSCSQNEMNRNLCINQNLAY